MTGKRRRGCSCGFSTKSKNGKGSNGEQRMCIFGICRAMYDLDVGRD